MLSIFNTRPQIYHNIQRIREIHEHFLIQLQAVSPTSASPISEEATDLISRRISKRLSAIDLSGFKGLQHRSLRSRNLKASINQRMKAMAAEPLEALEVVREIDKLVSYSAYKRGASTDLMCGHSPDPFLHMRSFVGTTSSSHKMWPFCAVRSQTGQFLTRVSRHCPSPLPPWRAGSTKRTNPCR